MISRLRAEHILVIEVSILTIGAFLIVGLLVLFGQQVDLAFHALHLLTKKHHDVVPFAEFFLIEAKLLVCFLTFILCITMILHDFQLVLLQIWH